MEKVTVRQQVEQWENTALEFKYTVSRGRDTYGYNICSLWINREKASSCNGGGYDMKGSAFGNWIEAGFQVELIELAKKMDKKGHCTHYIVTGDKGKEDYTRVDAKKGTEYKDTYYGLTAYKRDGDIFKVSLDGACGFSSIEHIFKALGYSLQWLVISDRHKNSTFYTIVKV